MSVCFSSLSLSMNFIVDSVLRFLFLCTSVAFRVLISSYCIAYRCLSSEIDCCEETSFFSSLPPFLQSKEGSFYVNIAYSGMHLNPR